MLRQVKVRGARVSLEEVEVLACRAAGLPTGSFAVAYDRGTNTFHDNKGDRSNAESVSPAIASASPDHGRLWGFFEPNRAHMPKKGYGLAELRHQLAEMLTPAQLPAVLVPVLGGFPLTTSGKVTHWKLPYLPQLPAMSCSEACILKVCTREAKSAFGEQCVHSLTFAANAFTPQVDRRALLRSVRKHAMELPAEQQVPDTKVMDAHLLEDPRNEREATFSTARKVIAQAVAGVLPNAQACVSAWLAHSESTTGEDGAFSNLTFGELGGTSLLAVEAAWRASNHAVRIGAGPTSKPIPPPRRLTADDFLRGTLEEAASILDDILRTAPLFSARTSPVLDKVMGGSTKGFGITDDGPDDNVAAVAGPGSPSRISSAAATAFPRALPASGKRRYGETDSRFEQSRSRSFFAASRAGAGFRHTPACLGNADTCSGQGTGVENARVKLDGRWSSCLSKCIDATPLVVLPKPTPSAMGRVRKERADESDGVPDGTSTQSTAPECLCRSSSWGDADGSKARKVEEDKSPACGNPVASCPTPRLQGSVYVGSHSGEFQALNLVSGDREWSFKAKGRIESGAACSLDGRTVFVGCHDGRLYAIDRRTGTLSWCFETGDAIKCTPVCMHSDLSDVSAAKEVLPADGGTVLVGSHDGVLRSLRETNGRLRWSFDCGGALFASAAHDTAARVVYAATTKGRVVALDTYALASGVGPADYAVDADSKPKLLGVSPKQPDIVWDIYLPAPCFSTPAVCDASGNVVLGCVDGGLYCLSSAGEQIWACHRGEKPVFSSPCLLPSLSRTPGGAKDQDETQIVWGNHDG